jgi:hypothetical protein
VKEEIKHDSIIEQRIYNTTNLEWENNKILIPYSLNYLFVPLDNIQPFVLMPRTYLLSDCRELYVCCTSSCDWVNVGGDCQQCKCGDQTSNPRVTEIVVRQIIGNNPLRTGDGIILIVMCIINATNVIWKTNFTFQPPEFGRYYFVPFDVAELFVMHEEAWCYSCLQGCACPTSDFEFRYWSLYKNVC